MKHLISNKIFHRIGNYLKSTGVIMLLIAPFKLWADDSAATYRPSTISELLTVIERNNPSLRIAASENEAEIIGMRAANIPGSTSVEYSPFFTSGYSGVASSELIVRQSFDFPTLYHSRSKVADAKRTFLDENIKIEARQIRVEAIQACLEYIGIKKQNEILTRRIATADSISELYQRKLQRGSATQLEANRIALTLQDLKRELMQNSLPASEAESKITLLNGGTTIDLSLLDYDQIPIGISSFASAMNEAQNLPDSLSQNPELIRYATLRPEVKAADAEIQFSDREISLARSGWLPEVSLGYRRNTDGKESLNGFLVGLDFSLFSSGKESKSAKARKATAELRRDTEMQRIQAETRNTLARLELLRKSIDATDTSLIDQTINLYRRSLELGQITLTEYYQETDILYDRLSQRAALVNEYHTLASTLIQ